MGPGGFLSTTEARGRRKKVGDKKTALEVAKKIQAKLVLGDVGFPEAAAVPKFSDYADTWLAGYATAALKWSTVEDYQYELANHVKNPHPQGAALS
jgi:hypothetical protein